MFWLIFYARKAIVLSKFPTPRTLDRWKWLICSTLPLYRAIYNSRGCSTKFNAGLYGWSPWTLQHGIKVLSVLKSPSSPRLNYEITPGSDTGCFLSLESPIPWIKLLSSFLEHPLLLIWLYIYSFKYFFYWTLYIISERAIHPISEYQQNVTNSFKSQAQYLTGKVSIIANRVGHKLRTRSDRSYFYIKLPISIKLKKKERKNFFPALELQRSWHNHNNGSKEEKAWDQAKERSQRRKGEKEEGEEEREEET